jgi:hypothetical protein
VVGVHELGVEAQRWLRWPRLRWCSGSSASASPAPCISLVAGFRRVRSSAPSSGLWIDRHAAFMGGPGRALFDAISRFDKAVIDGRSTVSPTPSARRAPCCAAPRPAG